MKKHTDQVLGVSRVGVALDHEVEELLDVSVEGGDRVRSNETVDVHIAVHAVPELPGMSTDVNRVELAADRADASIAGEPRGETSCQQKRHSYIKIQLKRSHQIITS